jgi:transcription elongation factor SPT5
MRERNLGDTINDNEIAKQGLLPNVTDPCLWMVKCKIGDERAACMQLLRKHIAYRNTDKPLQIISALTIDTLKGYIYVESFKQTYVKEAISNMASLRGGIVNQHMVPINEMTDVLKIVKTTPRMKAHQWVRIKRGVYKDDLAQVRYRH